MQWRAPKSFKNFQGAVKMSKTPQNFIGKINLRSFRGLLVKVRKRAIWKGGKHKDKPWQRRNPARNALKTICLGNWPRTNFCLNMWSSGQGTTRPKPSWKTWYKLIVNYSSLEVVVTHHNSIGKAEATFLCDVMFILWYGYTRRQGRTRWAAQKDCFCTTEH